MISSAQKAPVSSAALTALNVAVVRQVVFEHTAEQISERSDYATETIVQTAENNRVRNDAATAVIESKNPKNTDAVNAALSVSKPDGNFKSPDFSAKSDKTVDIQV